MRTFDVTRQLVGSRLVESVHAVALVERKKPITFDMQNLVERIGVTEEYRPTAFTTPDGIIVHPEIMAEIRRRLSRNIEHDVSAMMRGGI